MILFKYIFIFLLLIVLMSVLTSVLGIFTMMLFATLGWPIMIVISLILTFSCAFIFYRSLIFLDKKHNL
jgi:hypothetical protein